MFCPTTSGLVLLIAVIATSHRATAQSTADVSSNSSAVTESIASTGKLASILDHASTTIRQGRQIFRFDTFGDEAFWGGALKLHRAIEGSRFGGVGAGLSPRMALALGLKVDSAALPQTTIDALRAGHVNLDDPAVTLALMKVNAVIGVTGFFASGGTLKSVGIQCALCHSTVDDSVAPGIGRRLDGWANRDLNVGAIVALAPDLSPFTALLGVNDATVRQVLHSWGPGKFDAELSLDGKAFRRDGKPAALSRWTVRHAARRDQSLQRSSSISG